MSWFDIPTTQMPIYLLFVSAEALFDSAFSLWIFSMLDLFSNTNHFAVHAIIEIIITEIT